MGLKSLLEALGPEIDDVDEGKAILSIPSNSIHEDFRFSAMCLSGRAVPGCRSTSIFFSEESGLSGLARCRAKELNFLWLYIMADEIDGLLKGAPRYPWWSTWQI